MIRDTNGSKRETTMELQDKTSFLHQCGIARTPVQLSDWVDLQLHVARATAQGRSAIRLRKGAAKQLVEEVRPLSLLATRLYGHRDDVTCRWIHGNQSFDAIFTDHSKCPAEMLHLEITQASSDHDGHLRMEYANEHRGVSMIGPVSAVATGVRRNLNVAFEAVSHFTLISKAYAQVRAAIKRMAAKSYGLGTSLLVMVEDIYFKTDDDFSGLEMALQGSLASVSHAFDAIFVLGSMDRVAIVARPTAPDGWTVMCL